MSRPMVVIPKEEYDRLLGIECGLMDLLERQRAEYTQTIHCQMAQQAINIVTQQMQ